MTGRFRADADRATAVSRDDEDEDERDAEQDAGRDGERDGGDRGADRHHDGDADRDGDRDADHDVDHDADHDGDHDDGGGGEGTTSDSDRASSGGDTASCGSAVASDDDDDDDGSSSLVVTCPSGRVRVVAQTMRVPDLDLSADAAWSHLRRHAHARMMAQLPWLEWRRQRWSDDGDAVDIDVRATVSRSLGLGFDAVVRVTWDDETRSMRVRLCPTRASLVLLGSCEELYDGTLRVVDGGEVAVVRHDATLRMPTRLAAPLLDAKLSTALQHIGAAVRESLALKERFVRFRATMVAFWPRVEGLLLGHPWAPAVARSHMRRMLRYTSGFGKMHRSFLATTLLGLLAPDYDQEEALFMCWRTELFQAFALTCDDIMDRSRLRRGRPAWWTVVPEGVALNDGLLLHTCAHQVLTRAVQDQETRDALRALTDDIAYGTCYGQHLDAVSERAALVLDEEDADADEEEEDEEDADEEEADADAHADASASASTSAPTPTGRRARASERVYAQIVRLKTSYYSFYEPMAVAILLARRDADERDALLKQALDLSLLVGDYFQRKDDYGDLTKPGGTDIACGKCTWLVLHALRHARDDAQRDELRASYGRGEGDADAEARVRAIYDATDVHAAFAAYEAEARARIKVACGRAHPALQAATHAMLTVLFGA